MVGTDPGGGIGEEGGGVQHAFHPRTESETYSYEHKRFTQQFKPNLFFLNIPLNAPFDFFYLLLFLSGRRLLISPLHPGVGFRDPI